MVMSKHPIVFLWYSMHSAIIEKRDWLITTGVVEAAWLTKASSLEGSFPVGRACRIYDWLQTLILSPISDNWVWYLRVYAWMRTRHREARRCHVSYIYAEWYAAFILYWYINKMRLCQRFDTTSHLSYIEFILFKSEYFRIYSLIRALGP